MDRQVKSGKISSDEKELDSIKNYLAKELNAVQVNADKVRRESNDWDFSYEGRLRQFHRMKAAAEGKEGLVFLDFVCPINQWRDSLNADFMVWMDTIQISKYGDANKVFERPINYDVRIKKFNDEDEKVEHFLDFFIAVQTELSRTKTL